MTCLFHRLCVLHISFAGFFPPKAPSIDPANTMSEWVGQELSKSDRPDLTAARVVISGGI